MHRNEMKKQKSNVQYYRGALVRGMSAIGITILLVAASSDCARADGTSKDEGAGQSVATDAASNSVPVQKEEMMLTERMKKMDFSCETNGVCSKSSITIKDLKAVLGVADLKEMRRAPSSSAEGAVYILKKKGAHCIIRTSDSAAVISDDNTVVSATVNTKSKSVKDTQLVRKLTPAQKQKEKDGE